MEADSILLLEDMLEDDVMVKGRRFERVCLRQGTRTFEVGMKMKMKML